MDFVDYRKSPEKLRQLTAASGAEMNRNRFHGRKYMDYIEEMIQQAQERGEFNNLQGTGQPLHLEDESTAGDMAMAYHLLKNNGYAPAEVELAREIRHMRAQAEAKVTRLIHQSQRLHRRRVPPFASEKRAFNAAVEKTASEYEQALKELNSKILTLNLTAPAAMHQPMLDVKELVRQFRQACPLFPE
ncbi:MAG: DUF1992 domain-containing protein [Ktedonobacteraceae bacterium]|nr:DUF1992 domain-containing protein [Ktedonobacteraceae bacterium]